MTYDVGRDTSQQQIQDSRGLFVVLEEVAIISFRVHRLLRHRGSSVSGALRREKLRDTLRLASSSRKGQGRRQQNASVFSSGQSMAGSWFDWILLIGTVSPDTGARNVFTRSGSSRRTVCLTAHQMAVS